MKYIIPVLIGVAIFLATWIDKMDRKITEQVKSRELELHCLFSDGYRQVEPEKVVRFDEHGWEFENGYARNCETKRGH